MGYYSNPAASDAKLDYYADCDELIVCSQEPTTYTEATATYALGDYALTSGDFTKSDLSVGGYTGRRLTVAGQTGNNGDVTGTANHLALVRSTGTTLRYVTPCDPFDVESGTAFDTDSFTIDDLDPATPPY